MEIDDFGGEFSVIDDGTKMKKECVDIIDSNKDEIIHTSLSQWSIAANNLFTAIGRTKRTLTSGMYRLDTANDKLYFSKQKLNIDDLIRFKKSISDNVIKEIDTFWDLGDSFKKRGFLHRRGYLFYGPAGSGKTCLVQLIIKDLIEKDGIVLLNPQMNLLIPALNNLREIEPDRRIICVFEDLEAYIQYHGEDKILAFLDGEMQIDRILNIATTNYPEKLDKRIVARPRRFDRLIKIERPDKSIRTTYFTKKFKLEKENVSKWVNATDGFSFAAMAELVISVKCLGNGFDDTVKVLNTLMTNKASSEEYYRSELGFSPTAG